jgi:hypothetical protein
MNRSIEKNVLDFFLGGKEGGYVFEELLIFECWYRGPPFDFRFILYDIVVIVSYGAYIGNI